MRWENEDSCRTISSSHKVSNPREEKERYYRVLGRTVLVGLRKKSCRVQEGYYRGERTTLRRENKGLTRES